MRLLFLTAVVSLLIGGVVGWFLYEHRAGINLFNCAIVEARVSLHSRTELMETVNSGDLAALEAQVVSQLRSVVALVGKYEDELCTRAKAKFCQEVLAELANARRALVRYKSPKREGS